jgi:OOP family OmpA-OmpF porin
MALSLTGRFAVVCLALALAGCANPPIQANKALCMVVGAGLLGGGAYVIENQDSHDHDDHRKEAGAAGAAVGAALGYLMCGQPAAPAPAPAVTPAPAPAPAPRTAQRIVLRGVNFDFDRAEIRPDAAVILDEAASILNENAGVRVEVSGHTDATGTDEYNQGLSERRARSVADYLSSKGVSADRLDTAGYGESKPVADNATRDGRAQNRRVELNVAQ